MSIWNKVLLGLNVLVCFGVFYLALQALNVHKVWRESAQKHEKRLNEVSHDIELLKQGPDGNGGIREMRMKLFAELYGRGSVWYGCKPMPIADIQKIQVAVTQPKPHNLDKVRVVYLFEYVEKDKLASDQEAATPNEFESPAETTPSRGKIQATRFLGEFAVGTTGEGGVTLAPTSELDEKAIADLNASQKASEAKDCYWMIREFLPADSHSLFADLSEEEIRKLLPEEVVDEYLKDGQNRKLRDYLVTLKWYEQIRTKHIETKEAVTRYNEYLEQALAEAARQQEVAKKLNIELTQELAVLESERDAVLAHENSLKTELRQLQQQIDTLMDKNRVLARTIQDFQERAIALVNSKTESSR